MVAVVAMVSLGGCSSAGFRGLSGLTTASAAVTSPPPNNRRAAAAPAPRQSSQSHNGLDGLISQYAAINGIPVSLVHRVIDRESDYNARARNGSYYGLMQISHATAKSMGYTGPASGLLDAETNLKYAVRYLAGAYLVGGRSESQAIRNYSRGYYYDAKRQGLLEEVGLR